MAQLNSLVVTGSTRLINQTVATSRVTSQGPLIVRATNAAGSYDEGIRINQGINGYSSLVIGGTQDSTTGTGDYQFWIGTNRTNASYQRKLIIAHNGSTASNTYFYANAAGTVSPYLNLGSSGTVTNGNTQAVTGGVVYTALTNGTVTKVGTGTVGGTTTPIYLNAGVPTALSYTIAKSVPSDAVFTDTKVTSSSNHYTPATASGQDKSASASGATAAWGIDVVKGVTLNTDGKGHVTGISVTSGKIPNNPDTDTKVTQTATTTDANYEVLFSATADNTTRTETSGKAATLRFNPSKGALMEGSSTVASGSNSHAEGNSTTASGNYGSHAEGYKTSATEEYAHAEGDRTTASGIGSHAEGRCNRASGAVSHAEGYYTIASNSTSHAEGDHTTASGDTSHAEGSGTIASGTYSHAEGNSTYADYASHAEGASSSASGDTSHAEGFFAIASGDYSHAEGYYTSASGNYSHASGQYTCAAGQAQTVVGKYNVADTTSLFIVGNGTANNAKSNAMVVDATGKLTVSKAINELLTGTGTTAQDKGSGVSPRYFPARWAFNKSTATPADGDMITIKIPCAGHDFGVFLSLDNGTTYKPIGLKTQDNGRLTTHYPNGRIITLMYDSTAVVDSVFAAAGADARTNITGAWKVITSYLDGNNYERIVYNQPIKAGSSALVSGNIIVGKDGVYHHLKDGTAFDISYPILWCNANTNANATSSWSFVCIAFSIGTTQSITLTAYQPVFIKGTLNGNIFTPISTTPLTQTIPTSEDSYYYIYLGQAYSTSAMFLLPDHPIYAYKYNKFCEIDWHSEYTSLLKPLSANTTTGLSNWNIPSGAYQVWGQNWKDSRLKYTPSGGTETTVTDTGDWTMWLSGTGTTNTATFNMRIDGTYYGSFSGNLSGNASTATSATKATQDGDGKTISSTYLKLAGGTMTGSVSCTTSGANLTWGNITIYGGGSNGGKNSIYIGDDVFIGDCNVGGCFGMRPSNGSTTTVGFRFFSSDGATSLGGLQSTNGTLQWLDTSGAFRNIGFYTATATSGQVLIADGTGGGLKTSGYTIAKSVPSNANFENTLNTAGSTDTSSKIFLIGATSQAANPQTYSDNEVYATSGVLTTKSVQVGGTAATMQYNSTNKAIEFVFA